MSKGGKVPEEGHAAGVQTSWRNDMKAHARAIPPGRQLHTNATGH